MTKILTMTSHDTFTMLPTVVAITQLPYLYTTMHVSGNVVDLLSPNRFFSSSPLLDQDFIAAHFIHQYHCKPLQIRYCLSFNPTCCRNLTVLYILLRRANFRCIGTSYCKAKLLTQMPTTIRFETQILPRTTTQRAASWKGTRRLPFERGRLPTTHHRPCEVMPCGSQHSPSCAKMTNAPFHWPGILNICQSTNFQSKCR